MIFEAIKLSIVAWGEKRDLFSKERIGIWQTIYLLWLLVILFVYMFLLSILLTYSNLFMLWGSISLCTNYQNTWDYVYKKNCTSYNQKDRFGDGQIAENFHVGKTEVSQILLEGKEWNHENVFEWIIPVLFFSYFLIIYAT